MEYKRVAVKFLFKGDDGKGTESKAFPELHGGAFDREYGTKAGAAKYTKKHRANLKKRLPCDEEKVGELMLEIQKAMRGAGIKMTIDWDWTLNMMVCHVVMHTDWAGGDAPGKTLPHAHARTRTRTHTHTHTHTHQEKEFKTFAFPRSGLM